MVDLVTTFTVGQVVYESYAPRKFGKIIAIVPDHDFTLDIVPGVARQRFTATGYRVRWHDRSESVVMDRQLGSLQTLIDTTRRKLDTHTANYERALKL